MRILRNKDLIRNDIISASQKKISGSHLPHGHEFFEIEYVIDGSGIYNIDGKEYKVVPGALFFMNPTNIHSLIDVSATIINVMFSCDYEKEMLGMSTLLLNQPPFVLLGHEDNDFLKVIFSEIVRVNDSEPDYAMSLLKCVIYRLSDGAADADGDELSLSYVRKAMFFAHKNFGSGVSLEQTSYYLGLSPAYFSDLFHKQVGVSFKRYIDDIRFSYAEKLLRFTSLSVKEIYFRSGFNDYANFSRRFKERYGMTPSEYRKKSE